MKEPLDVQVTLVGEGGGVDPLPLPAYETAGAAGLDLRAAIRDLVEILPGRRAMVPTGIAIALPPDHEAQVRPRSGLAWRHGITVLNTPGTVDEDYRGELRVVLINLGDEPFVIRRGDRIAQLVVSPVTRITWKLVDVLDETARGSQGYGSTGR
jgi:dUTP pyrophosphatase